MPHPGYVSTISESTRRRRHKPASHGRLAVTSPSCRPMLRSMDTSEIPQRLTRPQLCEMFERYNRMVAREDAERLEADRAWDAATPTVRDRLRWSQTLFRRAWRLRFETVPRIGLQRVANRGARRARPQRRHARSTRRRGSARARRSDPSPLANAPAHLAGGGIVPDGWAVIVAAARRSNSCAVAQQLSVAHGRVHSFARPSSYGHL
jgi:hypothetical protein